MLPIRIADHGDYRRHRSLVIRPRGLPYPRQLEPAVATEFEDSVGGQRAHEAAGRVGVGSDASGDFVGWERAVSWRIGDPEFHCHVQRLGQPRALSGLEERDVGRHSPSDWRSRVPYGPGRRLR
jgi:hypothetical protein